MEPGYSSSITKNSSGTYRIIDSNDFDVAVFDCISEDDSWRIMRISIDGGEQCQLLPILPKPLIPTLNTVNKFSSIKYIELIAPRWTINILCLNHLAF